MTMLKKVFAAGLIASCATIANAAPQSGSDNIAICFQPYPVDSVKDAVEGFKNRLACIVRELISA